MVRACGAGQVLPARQGNRVDPSGQGRAGVLQEPRGRLPDAHQRHPARGDAGRDFGEAQGAAVTDPAGQGAMEPGTWPGPNLGFAGQPVLRMAGRRGRCAAGPRAGSSGDIV